MAQSRIHVEPTETSLTACIVNFYFFTIEKPVKNKNENEFFSKVNQKLSLFLNLYFQFFRCLLLRYNFPEFLSEEKRWKKPKLAVHYYRKVVNLWLKMLKKSTFFIVSCLKRQVDRWFEIMSVTINYSVYFHFTDFQNLTSPRNFQEIPFYRLWNWSKE